MVLSPTRIYVLNPSGIYWYRFKNSGHDHKIQRWISFFDGVHLPFKDISFDNIIALEVLEHVEELDDLMFEINRALKKDGLFVASIPFGWPEHEKPFDFRRFTTFGIEKLLIKNKFEIVLISKSGTLISSLLQIIIYYIDDIFFKNRQIKGIFFGRYILYL